MCAGPTQVECVSTQPISHPTSHSIGTDSVSGQPGQATLLVTSYTDYSTLAHTPKGRVNSASGVAAYSVDRDAQTISLSRSSACDSQLHNAAFLLKHPRHNIIYASTERIDRPGEIVALKLGSGGELTVLGTTTACGRSTCYLNLDEAHGCLTAVNYWDARLAVMTVCPTTGALKQSTPNSQVVQQRRGAYVDENEPSREEHWSYRQRWAHTHCAVTEPYTGYSNVFVCDLGEDQVLWYTLDGGVDSESEKDLAANLDEPLEPTLRRRGHVQLPKGIGPRHLVFHPTHRVAYVVNELVSSVAVLELNEDAMKAAHTKYEKTVDESENEPASDSDSDAEWTSPGSREEDAAARAPLTVVQTLSTLPEAWQGKSAIKNGVWKAASHCSEIKVHPSGNFVFVANRGHDSIAVYLVGPSGGLTLSGIHASGGVCPRNFSFCCGGQFLVVGNQDSNNLCLFAIDAETGDLRLKDTVDCPSPNYVYTVPL